MPPSTLLGALSSTTMLTFMEVCSTLMRVPLQWMEAYLSTTLQLWMVGYSTHASNYNIRRSQFSLNSAGDDGGVLFIGRVNSRVNIDESIFSLNDASDRGGVVAIIASSMYMEINRTNIFTTQLHLEESSVLVTVR